MINSVLSAAGGVLVAEILIVAACVSLTAGVVAAAIIGRKKGKPACGSCCKGCCGNCHAKKGGER